MPILAMPHGKATVFWSHHVPRMRIRRPAAFARACSTGGLHVAHAMHLDHRASGVRAHHLDACRQDTTLVDKGGFGTCDALEKGKHPLAAWMSPC